MSRSVIQVILDAVRSIFGIGVLSGRIGSHPLLGRYKYKPLLEQKEPAWSIRLLKIHSADEANGIVCSISNRNGEQPYHCLSYTWGDPFGSEHTCPGQPTHYTISCEEGLLTIRPNLYNALIHLFTSSRAQLDAIWVDAICINQDDVSERNTQVAIMHKIYRSAESVIAWLGPEGEDKDVLKIVSRFRDHGRENPDFFEWLHGGEAAEQLKATKIPEVSLSEWIACRKFLQRAYFQRMWIFQEIVCARDIIVAYGEKTMLWPDVSNLSQAWLTLGSVAVTRHITHDFRAAPCSSPHNLSQWRDMFCSNGNLRNQFGLLVLDINRKYYYCFDPRDKIYAHIGVCEYTAEEAAPHYDKSVRDVYTEFWWEILQRTGHVRLLTYVEDASCSLARRHGGFPYIQTPRRWFPGKKKDGLPSWVPNFNVALEPKSITEHYAGLFNASAGLTISSALSMRCERLFLSGYHFDSIVEVGESGEEIVSLKSIMRTLAFITKLPQEYRPNEDRLEATWKTMAILADFKGVYPVPDTTKLTFKRWLLHTLAASKTISTESIFKRWLLRILAASKELTTRSTFKRCLLLTLAAFKALRKLRVKNPFCEPLLKSLQESDTLALIPTMKDINDYMTDSKNFFSKRKPGENEPLHLTYRPTDGYVGLTAVVFGDIALKKMRLFRTGRNYVGKGAQSLKTGDSIWVFPGLEIPFILRKTSTGRYSFVGQAYVHGIMHGEAVGELKQRDVERVEIE